VAEDTWLRDRLALERTSLANERTLLAYVRTGLSLVVAAAAAIHFLESLWVDAVAWGCVVAGVLVLIYGLFRFRIVGGLIRKASRRLPPADPADDPSQPLGG
jgi:putative membrane protein